jgi:hypothetical protein
MSAQAMVWYDDKTRPVRGASKRAQELWREQLLVLNEKPVMEETEYDERLGEWDGDEYNGWRFITYEVPSENG